MFKGGGEGREMTEMYEMYNFQLTSENASQVMQCAYDGSGGDGGGRCDIDIREVDTWTPPLSLPLYNVCDSPTGFRQKL